MKIKKLSIKNFRAIQEAEYTFGEVNIFSGENETGKSSVLDSILWALSDETNVYGKTDQDNINVHDLEAEVFVELTVECGGEETVLTRTYRNVKKRNNDSVVEFSDPASKFKVDGIICKKKDDYFDIIKKLANVETTKSPVNVLRFIMDYNYLNLADNKKAREFIVNMIDLPSDDILLAKEEYDLIRSEVKKQFKISKKDSFEIIPNIISSYNADKRRIEKDLAGKENQLGELSSAEVLESTKSIEELEEENSVLVNKGFDFSSYDKELQELNNKKNNLEKSISEELFQASDKLNDISNKGRELKEKRAKVHAEIENISNIQVNNKQSMERIEQTRAENEERINVLLAKDYSYEPVILDLSRFQSVNKCPKCGFELDREKVEETKAIENSRVIELNNKLEYQAKCAKQDNDEEIERLQDKRVSLSCELQELANRDYTSNLESLAEQENELSESISQVVVEFNKQQELVAELRTKKEEFDKSPELVKLEDAIAKIYGDVKVAEQEFKDNKTAEYNSNKELIASLRNNKDMLDKTEHLKLEIKDLNKELAIYDIKKSLLKDLQEEKLNVLQASVNKVFKTVDFKVVDKSIKGALLNVCTPVLNGVKFNGVNDGNKYLVGVRMIEDIKKAKEYEDLPIVIDRIADLDDNSLAKLISNTNSQLFFTKVVTGQKEIKLEIVERG